ncbi:MAG: protein kinase [Polyangiaceae bacterium]
MTASAGKYRLLGELGRGGMATVYLAAVDGPSRFTKLVVVKQLHTELAAELEFREMFLDEARLAARLSHPNIVQTYEVIEGAGKFLLVMEYLEGQPLSNVRSRLARRRLLTIPDQVRIMCDVLEGLHAAHEATDWDGTPLAVVHRDVSPHNVFVTYDGLVKVVDFGVAKASTSSQRTQTGVIKGKISYMAPEQAFGKKVDRRADVFAVGIMLWEAIAERRMWKDVPDPGIMHYLASDQVPKLSEHAKDVHPLLLAACDKALATDPEQRFASAAEFRAALDGYLATLPQKPDARAFGATVAEAFAEERAKIRGVIERQLTQGPMLATGEISSMGLPQLPTPELSGASGVTAAASPQALTPVPMNTGTGLSMSSAVAPAPEAARSRNWPLVLAIVALAAGVVTLAVVILTRLPAPKEGTSAGGGPTAAPLPSVPAAPSSSAEPPKHEPAASASVAPSAAGSTKGPKWSPPPKPSATATAPPVVKPPDIHLNR